MSSLLLILLSAVLVCYYAPLIAGLHPLVEGDHFESVKGIAVVSAATLVAVAPLSYVIEHALLKPHGLEYLRPLVLAIVIMIVAQLAEMVIRVQGQLIVRSNRLVLFTVSNCAVLGVAWLTTLRSRSLVDALLLGMGTGIAFAALLLMFTALQHRYRHADIPQIFRDAPVALITVGLIALACMGFVGLIQE